MWNPGFDFVSHSTARMNGLHRAPCIYSWVHRGTREYPGIVLGLDLGGACTGTAFQVAADKRHSTIDYLRERELVTDVYLETWRQIQLRDGRRVTALTYRADTRHEQYAGRLDTTTLARRISNAKGKSGDNCSYFRETLAQLHRMGIRDRKLESVVEALA